MRIFRLAAFLSCDTIDWMHYGLLIGAAAIGVALSGRKGSSKRRGGGAVQKVSPQATLLNPAESMKAMGLAQADWPEMKFDIPFAAGNAKPVWPLITNHNKKFLVSYRTISGDIVGNGARRFMAGRDSGRYHVGVDLYADEGDTIVAMESGTVVNAYYFYHGTYALFIQCDSGLVINYAEIQKYSWKEFGISEGSKVKRGQAIARVGLMSGGSHMTHFETYMPPTQKNEKYFGGDHGAILNPTYYLLRAKFMAGAGRSFSGVNCRAIQSLNRPIPEKFKEIEHEDRQAGEQPGDAVLTELLVNDQWRPEKDEADGP